MKWLRQLIFQTQVSVLFLKRSRNVIRSLIVRLETLILLTEYVEFRDVEFSDKLGVGQNGSLCSIFLSYSCFILSECN